MFVLESHTLNGWQPDLLIGPVDLSTVSLASSHMTVMELVILIISDRDYEQKPKSRRKGDLRLICSPMEFGSPLVCMHRWEYKSLAGIRGSGYDDLRACQT